MSLFVVQLSSCKFFNWTRASPFRTLRTLNSNSSDMGDPQSDQKKLKISTTASDNGDCALTSSTKPRYKRRKIAIFLAYCGAGYQGMQKNPGAKTIEGDLEESLYISGAVTDPDRGCSKHFDWARAARTDKGVSAACQVISGRFYVDPPGLVHRLNASLPPEIRIFGLHRVTSSFNAKKFCDRRRYIYLIPVFALDPCSHPDTERVGSENELVNCVECSERGLKKFGLMDEFISKNGFNLDISSNTGGGIMVYGNGVKPGISSNSQTTALESTTSNDKLRIVSENAVSKLDILSENNGTSVSETTIIRDEIMVFENAVIKSDEIMVSEPSTIDDEIKSDIMPGISSNAEATVLKPTIKNGFRVLENCVGLEVSSDTEAPVFETTVDDKFRVSKNNSLKPDISSNGGVVFEHTNSIDDEVSVSTSESVKGPKSVIRNNSCEESSADCFRYGEKEKERFNRILSNYVGTHNFHNFTTRIKAEDPAANRFIISFDASTIVIVDGIEFVKCEVMGQSFMLHQIRKMMGLAVAIMRNLAPESLLKAAFRKDLDLNVPMAPEVGLFLDECFFSAYNEKWKDSHEELCMKPYEEEAEEFKKKHIYSQIAFTESMEGVVGLWLHSLNLRNYPDLDPRSEKIVDSLPE